MLVASSRIIGVERSLKTIREAWLNVVGKNLLKQAV